jgi:hypothetical protein
MQWYTGDWRSDPAVQRLSAEARGVWFEILQVMHELDEYEITGSLRDLAKMTGLERDEVDRGLVEIARCDVGTVTRFGTDGNATVTVLSRRRKTDEGRRIDGRKRVQKHRSHSIDNDSNADVTPPRARARSDSDSDSDSDSEVEVEIEAEGGDEPRAREDYGFDEVWDLYDKKESKLYARRVWGRLSKKDRAAALARIPDYVRATPDRKYRAYLATWLNGRKWEDEHLPATTTPANHVPRTTTLSARQYAGLSFVERLARGGFRTEDFQ